MTAPGSGSPIATAVSAAVALTAIVRLLAVVMLLPVELAGADPRSRLLALALTTAVAGAELALRDRLAARTGPAVAALAVDLAAVLVMADDLDPGLAAGYHSIGTAAMAAALFGVRGLLLVLALGLVVAVTATWQPVPVVEVAELPARYVLVGILVATVRHLLSEEVRLRERLRVATAQVARAEERDRLSRDLHDSATATLTGMRLSLAALRSVLDGLAASGGPDRRQVAGAAELATEVESAAHRASFEARLLVSGLRTPDEAGEPLARAVRRTVSAWRSGSVPTGPVEVEVTAEDLPEPAAAVRAELLAVLREALVNAGRHARAGRVRVTLAATRSHLRLTVSDDGAGFAVPADLGRLTEAGHFGLAGMAERLRGAGGLLRVQSASGAGTVLTAEVPLDQAEPEPVLSLLRARTRADRLAR